MKRLVVLVSGTGSNLQAIIDATAQGQLEAQVVLVVSNRKRALGLQRAERAGIPTLYFPAGKYKKQGEGWRQKYDADLAAEITPCKPQLVVLAGWMHVLTPEFLERFPEGVINLHPALPGQFAGTHAIERAYTAFQQGEIEHTGVMVHWVVPEIDAGPTLVTAEVEILQQDSLDDLEARIHDTEHRLIVEAVRRA